MSVTTNRKRGVVKWFNRLKGFGFISPNDGSPDVMVISESATIEEFFFISEGDAVEYDELDSNRGLVAHNVMRLRVG